MSSDSGERLVGLAGLVAVGQRAGLTDPVALSERLGEVERELTAAHAQLGEAQRVQEAQSGRIDALVAESAEVQHLAEEARQHAEKVRFECDRLAYALVRLGAGSAVGECLPYRDRPVSQAVFTRGRPYLAGDCVWEDGDRDAQFVAVRHVQRGGRRPSKSRAWRPLKQRERTSAIETAWYVQAPPWEHPALNGWAVRQTNSWVDSHWCQWGLEELSREHLLNVIDFLHRNCARTYAREMRDACAWMPCPVNAYDDCVRWLLDTPLYNALVGERARRKVRRGSPRSRPDKRRAGPGS